MTRIEEEQWVGASAYRVRVVVENVGWLPTYITKRAVERKAVRALVAEIELPEGATLALGKQREEHGQLEGKAYKSCTPYDWDFDPSEERAKIEWVVRAKPGTEVKVTVKHQRAGTVRATVVLK
ncbi:hypothetical protein LBMAG21_04390 [Armatimonadota bacterium]|nr:hypothetical protein LBMAG21_04390 [Armatimonadota bacterium]